MNDPRAVVLKDTATFLTVVLVRLLLLSALSGCSLVAKAEGLLTDAKAAVAEVKQAVVEVKAEVAKAKVEADVNKDGKTTSSEWMTWAAGGGLTALLAGIVKILSLQKQTDALYDATHQPVATGGAPLPALRS